jgi:carbon-monoxide dehydrogenase small subunit
MLAPQADGHEITTVESLAPGDELHPLQEAFRQEHGLQCGYCTPAFLLAALAVERRGQRLVGDALREELAGTLCRCTGYQHIVAAVERYFRERDAAGAGVASP